MVDSGLFVTILNYLEGALTESRGLDSGVFLFDDFPTIITRAF